MINFVRTIGAIALLACISTSAPPLRAQDADGGENLVDELRTRLLYCRLHLREIDLPAGLDAPSLNALEKELATGSPPRRETALDRLHGLIRDVEARMGEGVDRQVRELVPRLGEDPTRPANVVRRIHLLGLWTDLRQRARMPVPVGLVSILETLRQAPRTARWRYEAVDALLPQIAADPLPTRIEATHLPAAAVAAHDPRSLMIRLGAPPRGEPTWENPLMVALFLAGLGLLTLFVLRLWQGGDRSYRLALAEATAAAAAATAPSPSPMAVPRRSYPETAPRTLSASVDSGESPSSPAPTKATGRGEDERLLLLRLARLGDLMGRLDEALAMVARCHDDPRALFPHLLGPDFEERFAPLLGPGLRQGLDGLAHHAVGAGHPAFALVHGLKGLGARKDYEILAEMAESASMTIPTSELARRALERLEELRRLVADLGDRGRAYLETRSHDFRAIAEGAWLPRRGARESKGWPLPEGELPRLLLADGSLADALAALLQDAALHAPEAPLPLELRRGETPGGLRELEIVLPGFPEKKKGLLEASLGPLTAIVTAVRADDAGLHLVLCA